jgi:lysophospholipase L1-like esterase
VSASAPGAAGAAPRRGANLLLLLLGCALALALAELFVRLFDPVAEPRRHFRPGIYAEDPELGWALLPNYRGVHVEHRHVAPTTTNALGFRGPEWDAARRRAALRILVLGDSCTFGKGVADGESYPARLEARLRERGLDVAVFNAGIPGHDPRQYAIVLERLALVVRPHVVVLGWLDNDIVSSAPGEPHPITVVDGHLVDDLDEYEAWRRRIEHRGLYWSHLYRFLQVRLKLLRERRGRRASGVLEAAAAAPAADLRHTAGLVSGIGARAAALGAPLVLVLIPRLEEVEGDAASLVPFEHLAAEARAQGIEVVDVPRAWRPRGAARELYLPSDPVHMNAAGYDEIARLLADAPAIAQASRVALRREPE